MSTLFEAAGMDEGAPRPLADRLRPKSLEEVVGQDHLLGPKGPLGRMLAAGHLSSIILWGPPGTGKTTIARLLADRVGLHFEPMSAIFSGVADLKKVFEAARGRRATGKGTLLFVDEIHRFNRTQQDSFLPVMEDGTVTLVGATTENPSFELNAALLSRAQVMVLNRLDDAALEELLTRAETWYGEKLPLDDDARASLRAMADGDGRFALNLAEEVHALNPAEPFDTGALIAAVQRRAPLYDKGREGHYNLISALHKSIRGSDCDASLYYLARMLVGGEDPLYIARRLVRAAIEDIGLADPEAVHQALAAKDVVDFLGALGLEGKTLILTNRNNTNVYRSARNLQSVEVLPFGTESVYDVLWAHTVVIELDALAEAKAAPAKKAKKEEPEAEAAVDEAPAEEEEE